GLSAVWAGGAGGGRRAPPGSAASGGLALRAADARRRVGCRLRVLGLHREAQDARDWSVVVEAVSFRLPLEGEDARSPVDHVERGRLGPFTDVADRVQQPFRA